MATDAELLGAMAGFSAIVCAELQLLAAEIDDAIELMQAGKDPDVAGTVLESRKRVAFIRRQCEHALERTKSAGVPAGF